MHAAQDIVSPKIVRGRKISARRKKRKNVQFLPDDDDSDDFTESLPTKDANYSAKEDTF